MTTSKMHKDEAEITSQLVKRLLHDQFPDWSSLPLEPMRHQGTDNVMYKLSNDKVIRLPRIEAAVESLLKEAGWLPRLAPELPVAIPEIIALGKPSADYPFPWLIVTWLPGHNPSAENPLDLMQAAKDLAHFVKAMQQIDPEDAPICRRGQPLHNRDPETRKAIPQLAYLFDTAKITKLWEESLEAPRWLGKKVWIHGDLHAGNILCENFKITGIVDFGLMGSGDPAADLMPAWTLLDHEAREIFREILAPDEATWLRGRGWALSMGIVAYPYYKETNPKFAALAKDIIDKILFTPSACH